MLSLNIISPTLKKEIKTKTLYRSVKKLANIIFAVFIIYSFIFLGAKIILQSHFNQLVNINTSLNRGPENYVITVKDINAKIEDIEKIQNESIYWSYLIEKINNLVSEGIIISKIQASSENPTLALKGNANTRDSLLIFKENLERDGIFSNIELPIQSLLSKTNINFDINITLGSYEFK
jgi:hypothetical protein